MDVLTDVLAATGVSGVVLAHLTAAGRWGVRLDPVPMAAFHAVLEGRCWLLRSGAEPLALGAGDFVLLPTGGGHALASAPDAPLVPYERIAPPPGTRAIHLDGPGEVTRTVCGAYRYDSYGSHPLFTLLPAVVRVTAEQSVRRPELAATLRLLAAETGAGRPGAQTVVDRLVDVLFIHALRAWTESRTETAASWLLALRDPEIARAMALLHENPSHAWTLAELAARVGVSRATLARRFTTLVGDPPLTYLTRWRMHLAARRLRNTPDPIASIAHEVGYTSEFAFSRAFKRIHGSSPAAYRAEHHKDPARATG
ncbi:AraC family transcriptional regulator [Nocardia transvalensis]|uniref:AraC family transcriptional regulator n=1 Tax=Nocardia transvalensis TaxID=37333 RepID=UPI0018960301|nr:AraC family transcriptional regulator [Nocardia transvalensis]MBF6330241.1 AraC family transcriptional regulator [Nocardia transvalensis]